MQRAFAGNRLEAWPVAGLFCLTGAGPGPVQGTASSKSGFPAGSVMSGRSQCHKTLLLQRHLLVAAAAESFCRTVPLWRRVGQKLQ